MTTPTALAVPIAQHLAVTYRETALRVIGIALTGLLIIGTAAVVTVRAYLARRRSEQRFRALVHSGSDVIIVLDYDGVPGYVSPSVESIMGYPPQSLLGRFYGDLVHPDDRDRLEIMRSGVRETHDHAHRIEVRFLHADGTWHWHEVIARNLLQDSAVRGIVVNHHDISERRRFQDRLAHDATHDALTGLVNRGAFLAELGRALTEADRQDRQDRLCAALVLDINAFKQVNDTWGRTVGDAVLTALARLLRRNVFGADTVGRLGGDQFAICLAQIDTPDHAQAVARRIISALTDPLTADGHDVLVQTSIGIAVAGNDGVDADELLRRSEVAMHEVKRQRIGGWRFFTPEMEQSATKGAATAGELQRAITDGQLRLQYQPIVALDGGRMVGAEALTRWQHPVLGLLGPYEFISLAEASGLIVPLGEWVLEHACAQVRDWRTHVGPYGHLTLSVNLSPRQLDDPALTGRVLAILQRTGFDARDLVLEITEDALVNADCAVRVLEELHRQGIRLALDDFGTGYSSLRYLTRLPVDVLKLDRCFVGELDGTPEGSAVAEAVIRLSQALNLETVAEGIENSAQAAELTLLGYPLGQGFHFARPMDPQAVEALLSGTLPPVLPPPATPPAVHLRSDHGSDHLPGDDRPR